MKKTIFSVLILCAVFLTSCLKGVDEVEKLNENDKLIKEYLSANSLTPTNDAEGVYAVVRDLNPSARKLTVGDSVFVNYEIFLLDGTRVMGNEAGKPLQLIHGYAPLYGIDVALSWMRIGEKATVLIPYTYAFGSGGSSDKKVPGYTPIRLELELVSARSEAERMAEYIEKKGYEVGLITPDNLNIVWLKNVEEGDSLGLGKYATVAYKGYFMTGEKFDEGAFEMLTGDQTSIKGFDLGVRRLKMGEKAVLIFPSKLGYGDRVYNKIPAFSPLAFEVEITKVR